MSTPSSSGAADVVARAVNALAGGTELSRVHYSFESEANQAAHWLVVSMTLNEAVSACYAARVEVVSLDGDNAGALLGKPCVLRIERDESRRVVHGIVSQIAAGSLHGEGTTARLSIVPALQALSQRSDSRIFQDKTVPDVLTLVLSAGLAPYQRKLENRLRRSTYPLRELLVQYRETDLAFVQRLMSEEGIWCFFEQPEDGKAEVLVLVDANEDAPVAQLGHGGDELPIHLESDAASHWQTVTQLGLERSMSSTSVSVREYNWTNPSVPELRSEPSEQVGDRALYEPGEVTLWGYGDKRFTKFDTDVQAKLRWEGQLALAQRATGHSNIVGLMVGQKVRVSNQSDELNGGWIIVSVEAHGRDAKSVQDAADPLADYNNSFMLARAELPYRPGRLGRPRVHGVQTALVVGPTGKPTVAAGEDDIHTDEHGRIQVKLSWDRTDPNEPDATVTCFLRVAQTWGGQGWGFMFIPRIGMEVIVSFIDGQLDRPLVTGCVYNGLNRPAPDLPTEKTKSYIRTQSSPSGNGFNELQFEDADGKEEVYLHAQRDHRELVEHDQNTKVKANRRLQVGANRSKLVGGEESATIKKARTHTVHGDETLRVVDGSSRLIEITGNETKRITKQRELEVTEGTSETYVGGRDVTVKTADKLTVADGAHKNDHVTGQYNITADEHFKVQQGQDQLYIKDTFYVSSAGDVQIKNDGFHLTAKKDGKTTIEVKSELTLKVGRSSLTLKADGTIEVAGPTSTKLTAQGSSVEAAPQGVTAMGPKVSLTGTALTEIVGAIVKIN